jgi:membrane associated rhomboid family serine protease
VKYFVAIIGIIAFLGSVAATGEGVSHIGHLGGLVVGYLYLRLGLGRIQLRFGLKDAYRRWRMRRLRKKFEQYYQKRSGGGGPQYTVH